MPGSSDCKQKVFSPEGRTHPMIIVDYTITEMSGIC